MEYIKTNIGMEQDLIINYGSKRLKFEIKFNDYLNYWYMDIFEYLENNPILYGVKIKLGYDCFKGLGLNLGELYLIDTINDGSSFDIKKDFGSRLKLARVYNES